MVENKVVLNMDSADYWYALIEKGCYSALLICDVKNNVCYTFGGSDLRICKNIKVTDSQNGLYESFMHKIGKLCKKPVDPLGHYFSDMTGFVTKDTYNTYVTPDVLKLVDSSIKQLRT